MSISRPDTFISVTFNKADDEWTNFEVKWREEMSDGTDVWDKQRSESYLIEDLPAAVKTALQTAWNGMKTHRNTIDPL